MQNGEKRKQIQVGYPGCQTGGGGTWGKTCRRLTQFSGKAEKGAGWKWEGQKKAQRSCLTGGRKEEEQKRSEEKGAAWRQRWMVTIFLSQS